MSFTGFSAEDLASFQIPGFSERMAAIRSRIRPRLVALGEELAPALGRAAGAAVFPHVASHARRSVNPPDETWAAFGPSPRGYKRYPHLAAGVGRQGPWVRFVVKPECDAKASLAGLLAAVGVPEGYRAMGDPSRLRLQSGDYAVDRVLPARADAAAYLEALLPLVKLYRASQPGAGLAAGD